MSRMNRVIGALAFSLLFASPALAKQTVILGVNEGAAAGQIAHEMAPIVEHLNTSPTISVELRVFPNHDVLVQALQEKKVDLAFLGAVKYVEAHSELGAVPLVQEGTAVRSFIAVPPNSPIRSVEELKGKRFAFGYEDSTTTHLIPVLLLSKHGVKEHDLKATFAGHQPQKTIDEMLDGRFDACAVSDFFYARNSSRLRVLEQSDDFAGPPIVARKDLPESIRNEVRKMFLSYKPAPDAVSFHFGHGATPVTDTDYNRIRFLLKVVFDKTYH
jgi:phosphonate transport system substrate-binding protein